VFICILKILFKGKYPLGTLLFNRCGLYVSLLYIRNLYKGSICCTPSTQIVKGVKNMNSNKSLTLSVLALTLVLSAYISIAFAGTGSLRIDPPLPYMNESPAEFTVWVQGQDTAYNPIILLVMTESCYNGLSGDPEVEWTGGSITLSTWNMETTNGVKVPPMASNGAAYTVASLKDHLDTSEPIYWSYAAILGGPIVPGETYELTVHLESSELRMLVYVLGESNEGSVYDMSVPPTIPGFVVPEVPLGTVLTLATMLGIAGVYRLRNLRVHSP
jgi:hypothetical protein